ncbi:MAG TPA: isoprenylcysteine carboxylmethyltransferase family protein [Acidisarcina sp.]
MTMNYYQLACFLWAGLAVVWIIGMLRTKSEIRRGSLGSRTLEIGLCLTAFVLIFTQRLRGGWLGAPFIPKNDSTGTIGLVLTALGVALAIWARMILGGNWSDAPAIKQGHALIRRGPYAIVRHPIYTGFLLGVLGVTFTIGECRGLVAFGALFLGLWIKSNMEERFMVQRFGPDYYEYQTRVKALIPYIF